MRNYLALCVLASGSLKEQQAPDEERKRRILEAGESGRIPPQQGMRMIGNM